MANTIRTKAAAGVLFEPSEVPEIWSDKYSAAARTQIADIITWLNQHRKTKTWLATTASINRTTTQLLLQGKYTGHVEHYARQLLDTIRHIDARASIRDTPFIASSLSKLVFACCARARSYRSFGIITAEVGTGKTRALLEYMNNNANTLLIQADPQMSPTSLLDDVLSMLGLAANTQRATRERKYKAVVAALKNSDRLLLLDEAETVNPNTLHIVRRLRDKAEIGVVLAGTPRLYSLISPRSGQFDQIRSRTCYWPKPVRGITREDMEAVSLAAFEDQDEVDESTLDALWHHCRGSMRMLVEDLIPAIRDYGLKKHPLSAELVHAVAQDVLSLD